MYSSVVDSRGRSGALESAPVYWCQMRQNIARIARMENARWTRSDGTKLLETDPSTGPPYLDLRIRRRRNVPHGTRRLDIHFGPGAPLLSASSCVDPVRDKPTGSLLGEGI
jgi:hypothetical protein